MPTQPTQPTTTKASARRVRLSPRPKHDLVLKHGSVLLLPTKELERFVDNLGLRVLLRYDPTLSGRVTVWSSTEQIRQSSRKTMITVTLEVVS